MLSPLKGSLSPLGRPAGGAASGSGIVTSGLVAEYRFDEGSGGTLHDYVGGYNGTLGTGAGDLPDWVAEGLSFVASNNDVVVNTTMPDSVLLGAVTAHVVVKLNTMSRYHAFVGKCPTNGSFNNPLDFRTNNDANCQLDGVRAALSSYTEMRGPNSALSVWRMYSVTYTDNNLTTVPTFYVGTTSTSGSQITGGTGTVAGNNSNLRIGRRADGAVQLDGVMAHLALYNRALSSSEITANYNALKSYLVGRGIVLP